MQLLLRRKVRSQKTHIQYKGIDSPQVFVIFYIRSMKSLFPSSSIALAGLVMIRHFGRGHFFGHSDTITVSPNGRGS